MNPMPQPPVAGPHAGRLTGPHRSSCPCHDEEANVARAVRRGHRARPSASPTPTRSSSSTTAAATPPSRWPQRWRRRATRTCACSCTRATAATARRCAPASRPRGCAWVLLTDADLQFDLGELERFSPLAADLDLRRRLPGRARGPAPPAAERRARGTGSCDRSSTSPCATSTAPSSSSAATSLSALAAHGRRRDDQHRADRARRRARARGSSELGVHHRPRTAGRQSGASPARRLARVPRAARLRAELRPRAAPRARAGARAARRRAPRTATAPPARPRRSPLRAVPAVRRRARGGAAPRRARRACRPDPFYDAAVRSMGDVVARFLFGAFEPGGRVAIDKPPVDLWLQVASTKLLGFDDARAACCPRRSRARRGRRCCTTSCGALFGRGGGARRARPRWRCCRSRSSPRAATRWTR